MNYRIREIEATDHELLRDFLYEAIYIPKGYEAPERSILDKEELQVYIRDYGLHKDDYGLLAEEDDKVIGMIWCRIMNDYGHVDETTPSLAMSVLKQYRGQGVGTALLNEMLNRLKDKGYKKVSLSVQKENYAVKLYRRCGFNECGQTAEEYIMIRELADVEGE